MAIVDLLVKSASSPQLSADNAIVQHQVALLLHGDYTKWAWLSFSAATPPTAREGVRAAYFEFMPTKRHFNDWR